MRNNISYAEVLPVWWSIAWRVAAVSIVASLVSVLLGARPKPGGGGILGSAAVIPVSIWALRQAMIIHGISKNN